jgi:hypothetical protein
MSDPRVQSAAVTRSLARRLALVVGLAVLVALLVWQFARLMANPAVMPPDDFVEYWAAGRLNAGGENPYDPDKLLPLERAAGRDTDEAIMMWNPPWTLPLVMPFGLLDARVSQLLWLALSMTGIIYCADWTWRYYGGSARQRWLAWMLGLTFLPTLLVLQSGQIGPLLLLGVVGFLHFERRGQGWLAGAATVLIAIKPHLAYLFWAALLLWSLDRRRWSILVGSGSAGLIALAIAVAFNPAVVNQYHDAMGHHPPEQWISPTLGAFLRLLFSEEKFWLQFLPTLAGLAWFVPYWFTHRRNWDWAEQMPQLLLVSFATASYGAWPFDLVVLLLPVIQLAVYARSEDQRLVRGFALGAYVLINGMALALNLLRMPSMWFVWMTPALLATYVLVRLFRNRLGLAPADQAPTRAMGGIAHV